MKIVGSFDVVLDKSLVDTLLCCVDDVNNVREMFLSISRVMKTSGGRYIGFSLHELHTFKQYLDERIEWKYKSYRIRNPRYDERENCERSITHSLFVCTIGLSEG